MRNIAYGLLRDDGATKVWRLSYDGRAYANCEKRHGPLELEGIDHQSTIEQDILEFVALPGASRAIMYTKTKVSSSSILHIRHSTRTYEGVCTE